MVLGMMLLINGIEEVVEAVTGATYVDVSGAATQVRGNLV